MYTVVSALLSKLQVVDDRLHFVVCEVKRGGVALTALVALVLLHPENLHLKTLLVHRYERSFLNTTAAEGGNDRLADVLVVLPRKPKG